MRARSVHCVATGGLFVFFALLTLGADRTSLTADEPTYIACGYGLLARGTQAFPLLVQRGYTPLAIVVEALPLYLANPSIPLERLVGWPTDYSLFVKAFTPYLDPIPQTKLLARLPIIWLTMVLAVVVFRWGRDLWGPTAGLLALGVLVFDPLLLAHGRLANSDAAAVALGTVALYATWRWRQRRSWRWALATGALLGLTMLAKASGLLWATAGGLSILVTTVQRRRQGLGQLLGQGAAAAVLAGVVLWAGYGFECGPLPGSAFPVPAPTHWQNLLYLDKYTDVNFALGLRKQGGWWWYFPLAFLIKNPLPLLIGLGIALVALVRRPLFWTNVLTLGVFPVLYASTAILEGMNLGYRFMLPIHPFLYLAIGRGLERWRPPKLGASLRRGVLGALGVWYVAMTIRVFPYEIAYFNELVGGPDGGYRYLADSNVDWGQANDVQYAYLQEHPDVNPEPPAARLSPAPGHYIVGASHLQGLGIGDVDAYEWFRHRAPEAILAHSLLIYEVPQRDLSWVAQCQEPSAPLDQASLARGTGQASLRQADFDCTTSWLYPSGGTTEGMYVLRHDLLDGPRLCPPSFLVCPAAPRDPFIARHLVQARLSYEQVVNSELPALAVYEPALGLTHPSFTSPVYAVPAGTLPPGAGGTVSPPVFLGGPLAFLGVAAYADRGFLEVETWWQVTDGPITRPFSIMAHLVSAGGETNTVADGLGVAPVTLVKGDVIAQRHRFPGATPGSDTWLLTGAYWLDTMQRWTIQGVPRANTVAIQVEASR